MEHAAGFADQVHVVTPPECRVAPRHGVRVHRTRIPAGEIDLVGGIPRTTPVRTAWDLAVWLELAHAVTILDGLLRLGLVATGDLERLVRSRAGERGARRAARAFGLADARSQSPPESRLRVGLVLAGLPPPVPQHPVRLPGGMTYHPDLAWPEYRVAIEYDGHWHATVEQLHRDRRRLNQLVAAGWIVLHVTSQRLRGDLHGIVRETGDALRSRGWPNRPPRPARPARATRAAPGRA